ncbi:Fur family transcriptional regulator [Thauera mechernichensis]|uniref:Ferric uptake regulation protein n=1 Tax=Thauera mechernichensis TaxID=82788 RepID=A0ABW3WCW5_9RHOO|nr:transcriptional repressor [Thauera mechernichensis]MDG3065008.1 transcriptional repressor [Thauera mechernichensis]
MFIRKKNARGADYRVAQSARQAAKLEPRLEAAQSALVSAGLRVTLPRLLVLSLFLASRVEAMSVDQVLRALFERGDAMSPSTVYSALRQLDEARLIVSRYEDGRRVFEPCGGLPPARVVCDTCGTERILRDSELDVVVRRAVGDAGFSLGDYTLVVRASCSAGCPECCGEARMSAQPDTGSALGVGGVAVAGSSYV